MSECGLCSTGTGENAATSSVRKWNGILDCIKVGIIDQLRMFQERLLFGRIWTNYLLLTIVFFCKSVG
jgi:hypothetical protein